MSVQNFSFLARLEVAEKFVVGWWWGGGGGVGGWGGVGCWWWSRPSLGFSFSQAEQHSGICIPPISNIQTLDLHSIIKGHALGLTRNFLLKLLRPAKKVTESNWNERQHCSHSPCRQLTGNNVSGPWTGITSFSHKMAFWIKNFIL